jgi:hypothetical protein
MVVGLKEERKRVEVKNTHWPKKHGGGPGPALLRSEARKRSLFVWGKKTGTF